MSYIIYPTLDLYLYDLRNGLGDTPEQVTQNRANFLAKLPPQIQKQIQEQNCLIEVEYQELLAHQFTPLFTETLELEGYAYPVLLHDTYGLLLDCSLKDRISPQIPDEIATLKTHLEQYLNQNEPTLGQTWMISGLFDISTQTEDDISKLAKKCYSALIPKGNWEKNLQGMGKVLEGHFFELENYSSFQSSQPFNISQNHHVIIILYPSLSLAEKTASLLIHNWMRLWCYRNKILWAYHKNRQVKQSLQQKFTQIRQYIEQFQSQKYKQLTVEQLEEKLMKAGDLFAKYGIELTQLNYQNQTIETNLHNYKTLLESLTQNLQKQLDLSDINCLRQFHKRPFLAQIQKDVENLSQGLTLLEFVVNLIRAEVEIKRTQLQESKTESDRTFQTQFAIWGTAIAIGAVVADISAQFPTVIVPTVTVTDAQPPDANLAIEHPIGSVLFKLGVSEMWLAPWISLVSGVSVALILGGLLLCLRPLIQKRRSRR